MSEINKRKCMFFKSFDECHCNNGPDDPGECIYEKGTPTGRESVTCKWYKTVSMAEAEEHIKLAGAFHNNKDQAPTLKVTKSKIADQLIHKLLHNQLLQNNEYIHPCGEWCDTPNLYPSENRCEKCSIFTENAEDKCLFESIGTGV